MYNHQEWAASLILLAIPGQLHGGVSSQIQFSPSERMNNSRHHLTNEKFNTLCYKLLQGSELSDLVKM